MCGGDGEASQRAAAEAARQAEAERGRLVEEARIAKEEAERRAAEEAVRWQAIFDQQKKDAEAERTLLREQEAFRLSEQARVEADRKKERDAELARQEKERTDAAAAAQAKAEQLATYNTGRQTLVDNARNQVASAFAPYNDDFFRGYANDYTSYYAPQLKQQYEDALRAKTFNYANRNLLNSSTAARGFGRLEEERTRGEHQIASRAASASQAFRGDVDQQRSKLLEGIFGALNAAPVITADNVGESNDALARLGSAINAPVSFSGSNLTPPAFGSLESMFTVPTSHIPRSTVAGSGSNNYAAVRQGGGSGRLVI